MQTQGEGTAQQFQEDALCVQSQSLQKKRTRRKKSTQQRSLYVLASWQLDDRSIIVAVERKRSPAKAPLTPSETATTRLAGSSAMKLHHCPSIRKGGRGRVIPCSCFAAQGPGHGP